MNDCICCNQSSSLWFIGLTPIQDQILCANLSQCYYSSDGWWLKCTERMANINASSFHSFSVLNPGKFWFYILLGGRMNETSSYLKYSESIFISNKYKMHPNLNFTIYIIIYMYSYQYTHSKLHMRNVLCENSAECCRVNNFIYWGSADIDICMHDCFFVYTY